MHGTSHHLGLDVHDVASIYKKFEEGMVFTGHDTKNERMEICELKKEMGHPFFLGVQFHPEFLTKPMQPSPPFLHFVEATRK